MRRFVIFIFLIFLPSLSLAADQAIPRPRWSFEIKAGQFFPDIDDWEAYYGSSKTGMVAGSLAYKILRQVEAGIEVGYARDKGQGLAPSHGTLAGNVQYEIAPLQVFVLFRGVFFEEQWIVPYAGGGWSRFYYREKIENQATVRGSADGYHGRAGLALLLDAIDPKAANNLFLEYGIQHSYLFIEVQSSTALVDTVASGSMPGVEVNLGGTMYLAGLLFEF